MPPIVNSTGPNQEGPSRFTGTGPLIPGLILIAIGALFLLDNLHIVHVADWVAYWPVILIAGGLYKLMTAILPGGRIAGGMLVGWGALLLGDNLGYFRMEDWWPLILIGIGVLLLWQRTRPAEQTNWWWNPGYRFRMFARDRWSQGMNFRGNMVHEYAVFGSSRRVVTDQDFKGGRISAVFGGTYLDLSGASMEGNTAVLEISSVYGGATVRVPLNWNVEVHGGGVFGGFVDRTVHPPQGPDMKHLIVRGAAVFGGVTFKN